MLIPQGRRQALVRFAGVRKLPICAPSSTPNRVDSTGMKCLPSNKMPLANGNVLHDWHAEVLAIRAFNRFLLDECLLLLTPPHASSDIIRQTSVAERTPGEHQPFTINEGIQIHMYCSEAPCGDASMELVMDAQEDATPWTSPVPTVSPNVNNNSDPEIPSSPLALRGRSHFSHLGAVRCKPSRSDAPPTLSKSCTDKLALKQATSLLCSLTSTLISPRNAYIDSLVLPESQYVPSACKRAFSLTGRMHGLTKETENRWIGGYAWHGFTVRATRREFAWSRRAVKKTEKPAPSTLSTVWSPRWHESLIGGVLQGRKQFDPRGASVVSRRSMWRKAAQIAVAVGVPALLEVLSNGDYGHVKMGDVLAARRQVKEDACTKGLNGWIRNIGDDEFSLDTN